MKKIEVKRILLTVAALVLFSSQAWATPYLLGQYPKSTVGDVGDGNIQTWLTNLINDYNSANDPDLPTDVVGAHPDIKVEKNSGAPTGYPNYGDDTYSIDLPVNLNDYLVLHWGGQGGGIVQFWALNIDLSDVLYTFDRPTGAGGLSSYAYYGTTTPVPEPTTLLLLGSGLVALAGARKFRK